jgi:hypothetical protein
VGWRFPRASERRRRYPRACEWRRSRGLAAVARRGGRPAATLQWRTGKHRRRSRTGRAATAVSLGVRAAAIPGASGCGALRRATGGTLLWRAGKHRRCSRTGRAAATHPRPGGDGGCSRRGRLRQQRRRILEEHTRRRIPEAHAAEWRPLASPSRDDVRFP